MIEKPKFMSFGFNKKIFDFPSNYEKIFHANENSTRKNEIRFSFENQGKQLNLDCKKVSLWWEGG